MQNSLNKSDQVAPRIGLALASTILGVVSLIYSLFVIGGVMAIIGIILGVIHLRKRQGLRSLAVWGICLSLAGLIQSAGMAQLYWGLFSFNKDLRDGCLPETERASLDDWPNREAPDFSFTDLDGNELRLSDLRGQRVVLDFWATWCPPCRKEIPHFIELARQHADAGVKIIGISSEKANVLAGFAEKAGINYTLVSIDSGELPAPYSNVRSIPTTFFIDRNGMIQTVFEGYRDQAALEAAALAADLESAAGVTPSLDTVSQGIAPAESQVHPESPDAAP